MFVVADGDGVGGNADVSIIAKRRVKENVERCRLTRHQTEHQLNNAYTHTRKRSLSLLSDSFLLTGGSKGEGSHGVLPPPKISKICMRPQIR